MSAIRKVALSSVNYSTGTVGIRIPLFNIECGDLSLPIYLSYNSTGIKVNEPSGWVGQNWTLHAEPILTRNLRGHCDNNGDFNFIKTGIVIIGCANTLTITYYALMTSCQMNIISPCLKEEACLCMAVMKKEKQICLPTL